jgi:4-hydroxy-tetrahydrodipicolinate reductase
MMKLALFGYGKMGKTIERIAIDAGDQIVLRIDSKNSSSVTEAELKSADVVIEFSRPDTAVANMKRCLFAGMPVVSGTTGWYDQLPVLQEICQEVNGSLFYASNFSIGVNLFFEINKRLAEVMAHHPSYSPSLFETHHIHKLDAPSGTAITLAEQIIQRTPTIKRWRSYPFGSLPISDKDTLPIFHSREDEVPGTHMVSYHSAQDRLDITHTAFTREGFASGALTAAHWLKDKKGVFTMSDMLQL